MLFLRCLHSNYRITQRETNRDLSPLMLISVEPIELLVFVVNVGRHLQINQFERRPISRLQALNCEVEVGVSANDLLCIASIREEGLELLRLLLHSTIVL